jgi:hypothetical protein
MATITNDSNTKSTINNSLKEYYKRIRTNQENALRKVKEELIPEYLKHGLVSVELHYSGCGDSGEMTEVIANNENDEIITSWGDRDKNKSKGRDLYEDWSEVCYDLLTYDWYNNDGGGGVIYIDFKTMEIQVDGYYHETVEVDLGNSNQETEFKLNEIV